MREETLAEVSVFSGLWHQRFLSPKSPSKSQGSGYSILAIADSPGGDTMTQSGGRGLEAKAQGPPECPMNVSAGRGKLYLTSTPKISVIVQAVLLSLMSRLAPSWDHSKGHCNLTLCSSSSQTRHQRSQGLLRHIRAPWLVSTKPMELSG